MATTPNKTNGSNCMINVYVNIPYMDPLGYKLQKNAKNIHTWISFGICIFEPSLQSFSRPSRPKINSKGTPSSAFRTSVGALFHEARRNVRRHATSVKPVDRGFSAVLGPPSLVRDCFLGAELESHLPKKTWILWDPMGLFDDIYTKKKHVSWEFRGWEEPKMKLLFGTKSLQDFLHPIQKTASID